MAYTTAQSADDTKSYSPMISGTAVASKTRLATLFANDERLDHSRASAFVSIGHALTAMSIFHVSRKWTKVSRADLAPIEFVFGLRPIPNQNSAATDPLASR